MKRLTGLALLAASAVSFAAVAAPPPQRIRGTVQSITSDSLVVHPATGSDVTLTLGSGTKYAAVVKSDLGNVEKGSYIGTATKGSGNYLVALEVVVFPPSMRGMGDGHYDWDKMADTTLSGGGTTASSMTNGNVEAATSASAKQVNSAMTNGNVDAATDKGGAKQLTVSYKGGKQTIVVPPTAPIVALQPAEMSAVKAGDTVFVVAAEDAGKLNAGFVAFGTQGVKPPM